MHFKVHIPSLTPIPEQYVEALQQNLPLNTADELDVLRLELDANERVLASFNQTAQGTWAERTIVANNIRQLKAGIDWVENGGWWRP